jgi:hypothetical protein
MHGGGLQVGDSHQMLLAILVSCCTAVCPTLVWFLAAALFAQGNVVAAGAAGSSDGQQAGVDAAVVQLAAQVLHAIVVQHRSLVRAALRNMPPLPSLAVLKEVNAVLIQVCGGCEAF